MADEPDQVLARRHRWWAAFASFGVAILAGFASDYGGPANGEPGLIARLSVVLCFAAIITSAVLSALAVTSYPRIRATRWRVPIGIVTFFILLSVALIAVVNLLVLFVD